MLFYCMLSYLVLHLSVYFESRVLQNYLKMYAQNAGNRVSEVSDFKIFRGTCPRIPYKIRACGVASLSCNNQILG